MLEVQTVEDAVAALRAAAETLDPFDRALIDASFMLGLSGKSLFQARLEENITKLEIEARPHTVRLKKDRALLSFETAIVERGRNRPVEVFAEPGEPSRDAIAECSAPAATDDEALADGKLGAGRSDLSGPPKSNRPDEPKLVAVSTVGTSVNLQLAGGIVLRIDRECKRRRVSLSLVVVAWPVEETSRWLSIKTKIDRDGPDLCRVAIGLTVEGVPVASFAERAVSSFKFETLIGSKLDERQLGYARSVDPATFQKGLVPIYPRSLRWDQGFSSEYTSGMVYGNELVVAPIGVLLDMHLRSISG